MSNLKLYFFAPLGNVDDSILNLKLKHGFEVDSISLDEGSKLIGDFEKIPPNEIFRWRHYLTTISQRKKIYHIKNSFNYDLPENADEQGSYAMNFFQEINKLYTENIEIPLRYLRLFKTGNIYPACWYVYSISDNIPNIKYAGGASFFNLDELFHLDDIEIEPAQIFFEETRIPKDFKYLKLALENFELSYTTPNPSLAFLSLWIASEVLFNPGKGETIYKISRNFAVLLGNSVEDAKGIQRDIKKLYEKRSLLIHSGNEIWNAVGEEDEIAKLRNYVRDSIKQIIKMNLSKDDLVETLNSKGFGQ